MSKTLSQSQDSSWFIYIIENRFHHWYTGITTDVNRRFEQHQSGKGAKALVGKGPLKLVMSYEVGNRVEASQLEYQVKKLSKKQKIAWVNKCLAGNALSDIE